MIYKVEVKIKVNTDCEDEQANAEWIPINKYRSKRNAVKVAKSKSKCKKWYEAHVVGIKDPLEDPVFDAYYQNGKLEFRMF